MRRKALRNLLAQSEGFQRQLGFHGSFRERFRLNLSLGAHDLEDDLWTRKGEISVSLNRVVARLTRFDPGESDAGARELFRWSDLRRARWLRVLRGVYFLITITSALWSHPQLLAQEVPNQAPAGATRNQDHDELPPA